MEIRTLEDIQLLIDRQVEESTTLEYKRCFAKEKDRLREDIAKDISAMANANGGTIIYGLKEKPLSGGNSIPEGLNPISGISKDQITQIISSTISPKIEDIEITFIPVESDGSGLFVVKIPKGKTAHQNLRTHQYHKRRNATIDVLEDHEIRDIMNRQASAPLIIEGCALVRTKCVNGKTYFSFMAKVQNIGYSVCELYKLNIYINKIPKYCDYKFPNQTDYSYTALDYRRLKISCKSREPIFSGEILEMGGIEIVVDTQKEKEWLEDLVIDMILFYQGGLNEVAYLPNQMRYIEGRENINKVLNKEMVDDYPMLPVYDKPEYIR